MALGWAEQFEVQRLALFQLFVPEALVFQHQTLAPLLQAQPPQFWQRTRRHLLLAPAKQQLLALEP